MLRRFAGSEGSLIFAKRQADLVKSQNLLAVVTRNTEASLIFLWRPSLPHRFSTVPARSQSESQDRRASTWDMLKNGAWLAEADRVGFSVLITSDKGIGISNQ